MIVWCDLDGRSTFLGGEWAHLSRPAGMILRGPGRKLLWLSSCPFVFCIGLTELLLKMLRNTGEGLSLIHI